MTRDERIAAGWEECWGVMFYTFNGSEATRCWWTGNSTESGCYGWSSDPRKRFDFKTSDAAINWKGQSNHSHLNLSRFWRKPKAPPPLKVGDEVVVRGKVGMHVPTSGFVGVQFLSYGRSHTSPIAVDMSVVERVK